jgi:predicted signal transduction protein with EAL and GGDEF domain
VRFVRRVFDAIGRGVNVGSRSVEIGASIGISICPTDGREPEALLRAADIAMYRAKEEGRGRYRLFRAAMEVELRARAALEEDVRDAVQQGVIVPHYQPLIRLADSHLTGFEVLARWHHPRRGDVPPGVFIPVVEQIGLIADLTYALLRRACREALDWPSDIIIALNVSPLHLADPLLPVRILAILSEVGFPPTRLEIEITESGIAKDVDKARSALTTLKELGIKISLDDFGTGYSSLYRLRELHFDKIKIDRSFVHAMLNDPADAQLVRSILDMARNLGVPAIAEGVEQLDTIRAIMAGGGEFGQGYYFGKAMTAAAATRMITEGTGGGATIATG